MRAYADNCAVQLPREVLASALKWSRQRRVGRALVIDERPVEVEDDALNGQGRHGCGHRAPDRCGARAPRPRKFSKTRQLEDLQSLSRSLSCIFLNGSTPHTRNTPLSPLARPARPCSRRRHDIQPCKFLQTRHTGVTPDTYQSLSARLHRSLEALNLLHIRRSDRLARLPRAQHTGGNGQRGASERARGMWRRASRKVVAQHLMVRCMSATPVGQGDRTMVRIRAACGSAARRGIVGAVWRWRRVPSRTPPRSGRG